MIPKECKRLAEVDFPIAVVSKHSAREKSIRHGHPSTLHLWWARRPLASCRAVLLGLLLPDPCDPNCPAEFKVKARSALLNMRARPASWNKLVQTDEGLRKTLLTFIGDFANWDNSADEEYLITGRALVKAAYPEETPLVVDPFAGGGSIPLEALRLGCDAFASDLNPVACLILKVMLEDIPRHGPELADELRRVGGEIKKKAEKELAEFYPRDDDGATPIAYLWARTVRCEAPNCGAEIPLMRSFWLCKKANRRRALKYKIVRNDGETPKVEFEIFEPNADKEVSQGTVARAKATCLACGTVLPPERVRAQLAEQRGGADAVFDAKGDRTGGARMLAVVALNSDTQGRKYRLPTERDYQAVWKTQKRLKAIIGELEHSGKKALCPVPDEPLPPIGTLGFRVQRYGVLQWGDLFTARQNLALVTFAHASSLAQGSKTKELLSLALSKLTELACSICAWEPVAECPRHVFGRQTMQITWDFAEGVLSSDSSGSFQVCLDNVINGHASIMNLANPATPQIADACDSPVPDESASLWFTDPPYYDAVPYSDLSDFFFVWMKRTLPRHPLLRDPFDSENLLTPKLQEAVQDEIKIVDGHPKDRAFFEEKMAIAFAEGRRVLKEDGIGSVVFAHKTTEGWEALLSGMIRGGWVITGSWPIATEMASRLRARDSAALATSVHLICRPRSENAPVGDWGEVLRELPVRVGDWVERLQGEGVRGADLVFACIGPALEIFSRYSKVETAEGHEVKLDEYLVKVWEVVGRIALEQVLGTAEALARNGVAGVLEEDARLTALFLWTLQSTDVGQVSSPSDEEEAETDSDDTGDEETKPRSKAKGFSLVYDIVRRFAQPLGIGLPKWEGRIIETEKGVVRLLSVSERAKQLFGDEGASVAADWIQQDPNKPIQMSLFPDIDEERAPTIRGRRRQRNVIKGSPTSEGDAGRDVTTLDRVHAAMLLQSGGQPNALRALLKSEIERSPDFLRLANALSALYPKDSEEKRLLDAMLLVVPR